MSGHILKVKAPGFYAVPNTIIMPCDNDNPTMLAAIVIVVDQAGRKVERDRTSGESVST